MSFALIAIMTFACCGCNHFKILILLLNNRICPDFFLGGGEFLAHIFHIIEVVYLYNKNISNHIN